MNDDIRWKQRFNNYVKALHLLEKVSLNEKNDWDEIRILASVQAFEMVLELGWKLLKDYMQYQGLNFQPIPKEVIRQAFNQNILEDGQVWLDALEARKFTSHTYHEEIAADLVEEIAHKFLPAFVALQKILTQYSEEES